MMPPDGSICPVGTAAQQMETYWGGNCGLYNSDGRHSRACGG